PRRRLRPPARMMPAGLAASIDDDLLPRDSRRTPGGPCRRGRIGGGPCVCRLGREGGWAVLRLEEALARLLAAARPLPAEMAPIQQAAGRVAAADLAAPHPLPRFPQAAMDGYVCHAQDVAAAAPGRPVFLRLTGHAPAGHPPGAGPAPGEAWTIGTGAALPARGDRILRLEAVRRVAPDRIAVVGLDTRDHVVRPGELLQAGAPILRAGRPIPAAALAAAAAAGIDRVRVHRRP